MANANPILRLRGITKDFPGVRALDGVDLDVRRGEVLGLVGENGAGKSTLIKVIGGIWPAGSFEGELILDGEPRQFRNASHALRAGVSVVHQELSLVPDMTVAENLLLGAEPRRFGMVDSLALIAEAKRRLEVIDTASAIDPEARTGDLGVGMQQVVEIARALGVSARVVVLDEPTAALTRREADQLFELVRRSRDAGTSFVYISHHLEEVFALCDRVAVLRDGRHIATLDIDDTDPDEVVSLMTGKELGAMSAEVGNDRGETVVQVEHLSATVRGRTVLDDISLHVRAGEVVALAGAMGSGRTALLSTLFGALRGKIVGRITVDGTPVALRSPRAAISHGFALVPEDRKGAGLVLDMTVAENMTLAALPMLGRAGLIDRLAEERRAVDKAAELVVKAVSLDVPVRTLSGGNQQKVVLAKWLLTEPRILLLDEPTRGVDVGAKAEIYRIIRDLVARGLAVLMASSDLPEILLLADRIVVMRDGRIAGELARPEASQEAILQLAVGVRSAA